MKITMRGRRLLAVLPIAAALVPMGASSIASAAPAAALDCSPASTAPAWEGYTVECAATPPSKVSVSGPHYNVVRLNQKPGAALYAIYDSQRNALRAGDAARVRVNVTSLGGVHDAKALLYVTFNDSRNCDVVSPPAVERTLNRTGWFTLTTSAVGCTANYRVGVAVFDEGSRASTATVEVRRPYILR